MNPGFDGKVAGRFDMGKPAAKFWKEVEANEPAKRRERPAVSWFGDSIPVRLNSQPPLF